MKTQKEIFESSEADKWFQRNQVSYVSAKNEKGPIIDCLKEIQIVPRKVLEIGCSNGTRLNGFFQTFGADCYGIDPSKQAIESGSAEYPNLKLKVGTADTLPFAERSFDLIVFGFCLYLCDRQDLFKIAYEADRCLADNGSMVVMDFLPPFPYRNSYTHAEGVNSYKMDYSKMFSWNPTYYEIYSKVFTHSGFEQRSVPDERVGITILSKNHAAAYPLEPFKKV